MIATFAAQSVSFIDSFGGNSNMSFKIKHIHMKKKGKTETPQREVYKM